MTHGSPKGPKARAKVKKVMHEYKAGTLRSGSGNRVTEHAQAIAIAMAEARDAQRKARKR